MTVRTDDLHIWPGLHGNGSVSWRFVLIPVLLCMLVPIGVSAAPLANFTGSPLTGTAPLAVTFTDLSTSPGITNWSWNFGDGNVTNFTVSTNPLHIYATAGLKSVNLTVTNASGSNSTLRTDYINVTAAPVPSNGTNVGVFRPSTGIWYLDNTKTGIVNMTFQFGKSGDSSVVGDWI